MKGFIIALMIFRKVKTGSLTKPFIILYITTKGHLPQPRMPLFLAEIKNPIFISGDIPRRMVITLLSRAHNLTTTSYT